jgi:hypothetical protein
VRSSLWAARRRSARCGLPGTGLPTVWEGTYEDEPSPAIRRWLRPCLALLPAGVTWPFTLLQMPVVSYATFSPSPRETARLFVSVALFRQVRSSWRLPRPGCYPTPCSLECGLSSTPRTQGRDRPTDLRRVHHTRKGRVRQQVLTNSHSGIRDFLTFLTGPRVPVTGKILPSRFTVPQISRIGNFENGENLIGDFTKRH